MASFRKRPTGRTGAVRWQARYVGLDGKMHSATFVRKADAAAWAREQEARCQRGDWVPPSKLTFAEWADQWLSLRQDLKPKTLEGFRCHIRVHLVPAFGNRPLMAIDSVEVRTFIASLGQRVSASHVNNVFRTFRNMMNAAVENRLIVRSPCQGIRVPRGDRREMRFLSAAEVDRLAKAAGDLPQLMYAAGHRVVLPDRRYEALIYCAAYTGLRIGELIALRARRVNLFARTIEVAEAASEVAGVTHFGTPKNGKTRTVTIPRFLVDLLTPLVDGKAPEEFVFQAPQGGHLRHSNVLDRLLRPALRAAGLDPKLRFHDLRHTHVAMLIAQGAHPKSIQSRLGHSSIMVTLDTYGHLLPELDEALVDGFDATFHRHEDSANVISLNP